MRVFVYGTLKRGKTNHRLLEKSKFIGEAYTVDCFNMYTVGFPVLMKTATGGHSVLGEVYEIDDNTLEHLDALESNGRMYEREQVPVVYADNVTDAYDNGVVENGVWVYIGKPEYWSHAPNLPAVTTLNVTGELEWHP